MRKIKFKNILQFVVALIVVLDCETIWKWAENSGIYRVFLSVSMIIVLSFLTFINRASISKRSLPLLFFLFILSTINIYKGIFSIILISSTIYLMYVYFSKKDNITTTIDYLIKIMYWLSIGSLFFFIFANILKLIPPTNSITVYVNNIPKNVNSYFGIHYIIQKEATFGFEIFRNTGIFYEAPKFSLILTFCLLFELFIKNNKNKKKAIIFTLTIISTFSLTGFSLLLLIWVSYYLFLINKDKKNNILKKIVITFIIMAITIPVSLGAVNDVMLIKSDTASYNTRIDNYVAGFEAWKENPIFGAGYSNMETIKSHYSRFRMNDIGYSNSIFRILAQGGIYLFAFYLFCIVKGIKKYLIQKNIFGIMFIVVFLYLFISTSFSYNYLMYFLLFLIYHGYSNEKNKSAIREDINK